MKDVNIPIILTLECCYQKFKLTTFLTELLCDVNNLIFKYLYKFKVDIPINARVIAVQSLGNLFSFILQQPCYAHRPILPYNIIEDSLTSLAHTALFSLIQITSTNLVQRYVV